MVGEAGIEPTTPGLEGRCSIQLSYSPHAFPLYLEAGFQVASAAGIVCCNAISAAVSLRAASEWSRPSELT
jgi:hypothetical protein